MQFTDLKLTNEPIMSFIPTDLRYAFTQFLKKERPDIKYTVTPWRKIEKDENLKKLYRPYQAKAKAAFEKCGFRQTDVKIYDGFTSNIEPQYLFEKLKAFYGDTMDSEVQQWHDNNIKPVNDDNNTEQITLNITDPSIVFTGSFEQLKALEHIMTTKQLSENDIKTILAAAQLNELY